MSAQVLALVLLIGVAASEPLGSLTSIEEFPSLAQVESYEEGIWLKSCTATIITNRHVLSTASCFVETDLTYRRVRVGSSTSGAGDIFLVEEAIIHPSFGLLDSDADIAIIRLTEYLTLGDTVKQAMILGQGIDLPGGLQLEHAGWGTTAEGGEESSEDLFTVSLLVHRNEVCLSQYYSEATITENMVCVGLSYTKGRDLDFSDRGGPLFYDNTLVGVLSFGKADADDEYPAVATAVSSYTEWIVSNAV